MSEMGSTQGAEKVVIGTCADGSRCQTPQECAQAQMCTRVSSAEETPTCKHCDLPLSGVSGEGPRYYVHAEGLQRWKRTCAINPYGFNAEPVGSDCERICNGSRGIEPDLRTSPAEEGR